MNILPVNACIATITIIVQSFEISLKFYEKKSLMDLAVAKKNPINTNTYKYDN